MVSLAGSDTDAAGIYQVDASGKLVRWLVKRDEQSSIYTQFSWELDMQPSLKRHYGKDDTFQHMEDLSRTQYIESDGWIYTAYWPSVYGLRCLGFSKKE